MKKIHLIATAITATVVVLALLLAPFLITPKPSLSKIILAIQPTQSPLDMRNAAEELASFIEQKVGVPVEVYIPTDYTGVIEGLRYGNVHVALMGSWPAYLALKRANVELLLAEVRTVAVDGERVNATYYYSYWIVPMDSPYSSLEELRGKRVCFPSQVSSSGYLAPMARLVELSLIAKRPGEPVSGRDFFGEVVFGGGYGQCWEALRAGQVDVTVLAGDVSYELYIKAMNSSKVIEKQGPLPSHAVVVSSDLPEDIKQRLREAFMDLAQPQHRGLMKRLVSALFIGFEARTAEEHLGPLERFIELTGLQYS
ncbi:MAG: phosphate/phosphite/phosphonate ABC transporter substrate-binding protein [Nitrososphaerota archaeon]